MKYDELDAAIIARIRSGFVRFYEIWGALTTLAYRAVPHCDPCRVVDRRLQALRKQGKIACFGQCWSVLDKEKIS